MQYNHIETKEKQRKFRVKQNNIIPKSTQASDLSYLSQAVRPKIIAAIPCFNTESTIGEVVSRAMKYVDLVMVIDDGSTDNTAQVAEAAGAAVVSHRNREGYAEGIKTSFEVAKTSAAEILVTLDGDAQHNPDEIQKVLAPILKDGADIVIGSRFLPHGKEGEAIELTDMPRYRRFGITVITWLFNLGSRVKVSDTQSGFRAYSRRVLESCHPTERGMGISVEMLIEARQKNFLIREVPITCIYHQSGSTQNPISHGLSVVFTLVKLRLQNRLNWRRKRAKLTPFELAN